MSTITIDVKELLGNPEEVHDEVVHLLASNLQDKVQRAITAQIDSVLSSALAKAIEEHMPQIVDQVMHAKYRPVDRYGSRSEETTFQAELVKQIAGQLVYKDDGSSYTKNAFTKAVNSAVEGHCKKWQAEFNKTVDAAFVKQCLDQAQKALREKFGIGK